MVQKIYMRLTPPRHSSRCSAKHVIRSAQLYASHNERGQYHLLNAQAMRLFSASRVLEKFAKALHTKFRTGPDLCLHRVVLQSSANSSGARVRESSAV
jgi:hypothetical protein